MVPKTGSDAMKLGHHPPLNELGDLSGWGSSKFCCSILWLLDHSRTALVGRKLVLKSRIVEAIFFTWVYKGLAFGAGEKPHSLQQQLQTFHT